jgi:hypothetical protein
MVSGKPNMCRRELDDFIDARARGCGIRQGSEPRELVRRDFATCSVNFSERHFISRVLPR